MRCDVARRQIGGEEPIVAGPASSPIKIEEQQFQGRIAEHRGECVMAREGTVVVGAFHPELTDDPAVHQYFADLVRRSSGAPGSEG